MKLHDDLLLLPLLAVDDDHGGLRRRKCIHASKVGHVSAPDGADDDPPNVRIHPNAIFSGGGSDAEKVDRKVWGTVVDQGVSADGSCVDDHAKQYNDRDRVVSAEIHNDAHTETLTRRVAVVIIMAVTQVIPFHPPKRNIHIMLYVGHSATAVDQQM